MNCWYAALVSGHFITRNAFTLTEWAGIWSSTNLKVGVPSRGAADSASAWSRVMPIVPLPAGTSIHSPSTGSLAVIEDTSWRGLDHPRGRRQRGSGRVGLHARRVVDAGELAGVGVVHGDA